jgi:DNA-binding NtrC family response regulator
MKSISIFIVEDDVFYASVLTHYLSLNPDYEVKKFTTAAGFLKALPEKPDVVTLDYVLPDASAEQVLQQIKEQSPETKVIIISAQENIKIAIDLLKHGADDYIVKDEETQDRLWISLKNLRENIELKKEVAQLKEAVTEKYNFQKAIIGNSEAIKRIFSLMEKAVHTNITVSITGETGTGKELVAKSIHFNSVRKNKPFVAVNMASIPAELIESELFGHEKGAFTGALSQRIGKFEEAHKGTLFLDEIGEMNISLQAKLLRALQEREIVRVGGNQSIAIDVRIIVATNRNLLAEVKKGRFREDLYYRLLGLPIHLPPLRERENDILLIANYFIEQFSKENHLPKKVLTLKAKHKLMQYPFPGNIRELKSIIELACVLSDTTEITEKHIELPEKEHFFGYLHEPLTIRQYMVQIIQHNLEKHNYDVMAVSKKLNIGKSTLYRMIKNKEIMIPEDKDSKGMAV